MPPVFRRLYGIAVCLLLLYTSCAQNSSVYSPEVEKKIRLVEDGLSGWAVLENDNSSGHWNLEERMKYYRVNGVSIAVIKNYKLEWARGYGFADTSDNRRVTSTTLFQAASISKSINALGLLRLADKQQVRLSCDINTYLKSWKFPESSFTSSKKVTIAHLLSHTGGITVHGFPGYEWADSIPADNDILDGKRPANTAAVRSFIEPGTRYQYSGGGTTISKKIIMDVTGMAYDMYMWKQVLEPIGMSNSFYTQPPPPGSFRILSSGYYADGREVKGNFHIYPEQAADGLWTNPTDLSKYIIEMQLSLLGKSNKVLSKPMTDTMLTPYIDTSAALGVFINNHGGQKYFQHGGANEGFRCQYFGSLENGNGVVVMVNSDNGGIIREIINSVATVYEWKGFYTPAVKKLVAVPADTLLSYAGEYQFGANHLVITRDSEGLSLSQNGSPRLRMNFTAAAGFFLFEVPAEFSFLKNETGSVTTLLIKQGGAEYRATKM